MTRCKIEARPNVTYNRMITYGVSIRWCQWSVVACRYNERKTKMMITRSDGLEMGYCEACGNYVPAVEAEGSLVCGYEFVEYPEIATVLR